jgi:hypothetical protein
MREGAEQRMKSPQIFSHRRPTKITLIQDDPPFTEEQLRSRQLAVMSPSAATAEAEQKAPPQSEEMSASDR